MGGWPFCGGEVIGASAKAQTIVEFPHRITSVISLIIVTGLVVWCWRVTKKGNWARYSAVLAAAFLTPTVGPAKPSASFC
jgi:heme a synthase